jgi:AcrR family transcriptional regulator
MADRADGPDSEVMSAPGSAGQRRERILRAAREVIIERGFSGTRISDVADRSGMSPALVLYYFRSKVELLTEAIRYSEDSWYADGHRRLAAIPTAASRLEELVAMTCLPEEDPGPSRWWVLWLDLWAQAARHPDVGRVRQRADERWRELIRSQVLAGQEAGEFRCVDAREFAICLSSMLDGFAVRAALDDPVAGVAFETSMEFVAGQLGFGWAPPERRAATDPQDGDAFPQLRTTRKRRQATSGLASCIRPVARNRPPAARVTLPLAAPSWPAWCADAAAGRWQAGWPCPGRW